MGERQYLYDAANRQIRILADGKEIQENRYDGEGLRAGVTVNGKSTTFLYADGNLYGELDEGGRLTSRYIRGAGLAGLEYQGRLYGIHRDEQLSTGWITGKNGTPENAYEYDAFGTLLGIHGNIPCRLLYSSQQYDAETEQYYLRARYYNPVIGRFMQEDAYRGDGLNLYAYCANNPVMYYDPSGESSDCNHGADVEKNAQKENVTGEGESGTQYNQRVIKAIEKKKNFYRAEVDYYDCSEIADDLYKASGENGTIYTITPNEKHNLVVPEYGKNVSFDYHTVYSDNSYVYDPRYDNTPIPESEYFDMIKMLNPKGIMINKD